MPARSPHFLLFSDATGDSRRAERWRFVLQSVGGQEYLAAEDVEPGTRQSRLELLAVVRGLEALDQPSRVTLVTQSRYVCRGIRRGINQWRARRWRWEHFGELVPIRDHDLWQRVDRAMKFHDIDCCPWLAERIDAPLETDAAPAALGSEPMDADEPRLRLSETEDGHVDEGERHVVRPAVSDLAACSGTMPGEVARPLIASCRSRRELEADRAARWSLWATVDRLRQNVLAPINHLWRPSFTRAA